MANSPVVRTSPIALAITVAATVAVDAAPEQQLLVVCSPGSPGTTESAQPRMDAFAAALSAKAGVSLAAVYDPADTSCAKRVASAAIAIVTLPFYLEHAKDLDLHPRLDIVQKGRPALDRWALVAQKGRITSADALSGFTIVSTAAFAPGFVRGSALHELGRLPANVTVHASSAVMSALHRAADGEPVAVLVDGQQEAALSTLPFAAKLEVVAHSPPMPTGLVVTIDSRMPSKAWQSIEAALLAMTSEPAGTSPLDAIQVDKFVPVDAKALAAAQAAYAP